MKITIFITIFRGKEKKRRLLFFNYHTRFSGWRYKD